MTTALIVLTVLMSGLSLLFFIGSRNLLKEVRCPECRGDGWDVFTQDPCDRCVGTGYK